MRPAAELGPIIVCLDTSGSMYGAREVVAKAVVLECMRGAHRQDRKCFVYAFRCAPAALCRHALFKHACGCDARWRTCEVE